ncbi:MAG: hypothetical protein C5B45_04245 [Chlamydiae bacterium]|nr:MAG: hypothetical protein C5B45_04245 [Chlamydiota bacterium]
MFSLEETFKWKSNLLTHGCRVAPNTSFPPSIALKKIHLYAHSSEKYHQPIPDDLVLPNQIISRIRYHSHSPFILESTLSGYQVRHEMTAEALPVSFVPLPAFTDLIVSELPISSICSFLGADLLGITPSNYCFYFQQGKQCRFCEILPTFKKEVEYLKTFKSLDVIENSILTALTREERLRFVAITTGNIHSYDATVDYFVQIGERLQGHPIFQKAEQVLATLMPPDDLSKIALLREKGFTKIYFPLEVFEPNHFLAVCPGKADYGYERILKALETAVQAFGSGHVYTNFVYGIQSLNNSLESSSYDPEKENDLSLKAVKAMLSMSVIPAFTLYHYGGYNSIGNVELNTDLTPAFFREWGELVRGAGIVPAGQETVLFSPLSLSNTLFNDGYCLAMQKEKIWT